MRQGLEREHALVLRWRLESAVDDALRDEPGRCVHQRREGWDVQERSHDAGEGIDVKDPVYGRRLGVACHRARVCQCVRLLDALR